jgi:hypothetical protein
MSTTPTPTPPPDRWSLWFTRLMQLVGLGIVCYETIVVQRDRPWLLLVAVAMMIGAQGLRLLLRGARGIMEEAGHE